MKKAIVGTLLLLSIGTMLIFNINPVSAIDLSAPTIWVEDPWGVTIIDKSSDPDAWDGKAVDNVYIYEEEGVYYAFYEGEDKYGHEQIGLARSTDFLTWTKLSVDNPILTKGAPGTWESERVKIPVVTKHLDTYYLFYTGGNESGYMGIGLATSTDMFHWTKYPGNPVIPRVPGTWENHVSTATNILEVNGEYWMLYRGFTSPYVNQKIGIAISTDLIHWNRHPANPLSFPTEIYNFPIFPEKIDGYYYAMPQMPEPRTYFYSTNLIDWIQGLPCRFSAAPGIVQTPSNPVLIGDTYWMLFEKIASYDRLFRARLIQAGPTPPPSFDNFQNHDLGTDGSPGWDPIIGTWNVEYDVSPNKVYSQSETTDKWQRSVATTIDLENFTLTAKGKLVDGTGWVGVVFLHSTGFYSFGTVYDGRNIARLFKSPSGVWPDVEWAQDASFFPVPGQYYEFKVIVQGNTIECYIDDTLLISRVDPSILPAGRAGLFATKAHAHFDDFHLWSMSYLGGNLQYEAQYGMYLPTMPPGTGTFGTVIEASPSFKDGYHYDDLGTAADDREIPESWFMEGPMPDYTAGDALDWHFIWIHNGQDYVIWDMGSPVQGVRVYPSQDHGPYPEEFNEFDLYCSNDMTIWKKATQIALYYDDITNVRTHDGVKDYYFGSSYRYVKIKPNESYPGARDIEIDAVEVLKFPPSPVPVGGVWVPINKSELLTPWITLASLITVAAVSIVYAKRRKKQQN